MQRTLNGLGPVKRFCWEGAALQLKRKGDETNIQHIYSQQVSLLRRDAQQSCGGPSHIPLKALISCTSVVSYLSPPKECQQKYIIRRAFFKYRELLLPPDSFIWLWEYIRLDVIAKASLQQTARWEYLSEAVADNEWLGMDRRNSQW